MMPEIVVNFSGVELCATILNLGGANIETELENKIANGITCIQSLTKVYVRIDNAIMTVLRRISFLDPILSDKNPLNKANAIPIKDCILTTRATSNTLAPISLRNKGKRGTIELEHETKTTLITSNSRKFRFSKDIS
jgi:hypothetical protein